MPRHPAILSAYLAVARLSPPLWRAALAYRARRGKEDPARLPEKYGHPSAKRPDGPLIWFHAVSVGESLALLKLFRKLRAAYPDLGILLTTSTLGSVKALDKTGLPDGVVHQYFPIDTPGAVARFLDHWRPDLHVIAEADMWPLMMTRVRGRGIPMILLNTTITPRRFRQRMRGRALYAHLFGYFDALLMQDQTAIDRFIEPGTPNIVLTGNSFKNEGPNYVIAGWRNAEVARWPTTTFLMQIRLWILWSYENLCLSVP